MESLPVVDYSRKDRDTLAGEVVHTMETLGFLFLENVPGYDEDELWWCVNFFFHVMPPEKKIQVARRLYNPESKNFYRGYFGTNMVGSSYKEGFEMGRDMPKDDPDYESSLPMSEHTLWPSASEDEDEAAYKKFREILTRYELMFRGVALDLVRIIALGLGMNENYFDCLFAKQIATLRLINYPVHNFDIPAEAYASDGKLISTAEHIDTSVITFVSTFDYEGLQVLKEDGSWLDVVPRKNSLIVNLGSIFSKMTNNCVKATLHRVLAIGRPRQSAAFFFGPSFHAMVPNSLPENRSLESAALYPQDDCFEYGPFMMDYMERFVEWRGFRNRD